MDKSMIVALHEFKVNVKRKEFLFFAFLVPALLLIFAMFISYIGNKVSLSDMMAMQASQAFFAFPSTIAMVFSMAIFLSANFLLQSVSTEKENRIMEVLMSTISFKQLFIGKILGLGALGLLQFASWIITGLLVYSMAAPETFSLLAMDMGTIGKLFLYLIFFILGYLVYASVLAAIGALTETKIEAQQIGSILTMFSLIPSMGTLFLTEKGDMMFGTLLTLFPLTAPITAIVRVFLEKITIVEIITSIGILLLTTVVVVAITARLFRAEILMYGKKFSTKELIQFIMHPD